MVNANESAFRALLYAGHKCVAKGGDDQSSGTTSHVSVSPDLR